MPEMVNGQWFSMTDLMPVKFYSQAENDTMVFQYQQSLKMYETVETEFCSIFSCFELLTLNEDHELMKKNF